MSNNDHPIWYTLFNEAADNAAKSISTTWGEFADSLIEPHPIVTEDAALLPLFNAWRYKDVSDPTVDNGVHKDGKPVQRFSPTHVRRHAPNLTEMSMLVLDSDGALPIVKIDTQLGGYEYACYTSLNHLVNGVDKFRAVLPFSYPMSVADYRRLKPAIEIWMEQLVADHRPELIDRSTFHIGQIFRLPAVREENQKNARSWRNEGALFDWKLFESISIPAQMPSAGKSKTNGTTPSEFVLKPDDVLETASGFIQVRDIDRKISDVLCPFHPDRRPREFVAVSKGGLPYLVCHRCGTIYMERTKTDPILDGLAKIRERKRINAAKGNSNG